MAAFYERNLNLPDAACEIRKFRSVLKSHLPGASGLFQERLSERLTWVDLDILSKQQAELARQYLERRDYVRAALFGWEALVSLVCENQNLDTKILIYAKNKMSHTQFRSGNQNWDNRNGKIAWHANILIISVMRWRTEPRQVLMGSKKCSKTKKNCEADYKKRLMSSCEVKLNPPCEP